MRILRTCVAALTAMALVIAPLEAQGERAVAPATLPAFAEQAIIARVLAALPMERLRFPNRTTFAALLTPFLFSAELGILKTFPTREIAAVTVMAYTVMAVILILEHYLSRPALQERKLEALFTSRRVPLPRLLPLLIRRHGVARLLTIAHIADSGFLGIIEALERMELGAPGFPIFHEDLLEELDSLFVSTAGASLGPEVLDAALRSVEALDFPRRVKLLVIERQGILSTIGLVRLAVLHLRFSRQNLLYVFHSPGGVTQILVAHESVHEDLKNLRSWLEGLEQTMGAAGLLHFQVMEEKIERLWGSLWRIVTFEPVSAPDPDHASDPLYFPTSLALATAWVLPNFPEEWLIAGSLALLALTLVFLFGLFNHAIHHSPRPGRIRADDGAA